MPHGYSVREAVNEGEVHSALCKATAGYGGVVRFARRIGFSRVYVQGMLYGAQRMSAKVAGVLGYELRWVKIEKKYGGTAMSDRCSVYEPNKGQCLKTANLTRVVIRPPRKSTMLGWKPGTYLIMSLCPEHWKEALGRVSMC